jgi:prephenate dehydratase
VEHCLLGPKGAKLEDVTEVHSHVHALGQCRVFLKQHKLKPVVHVDTAGAARDVAQWSDPARAAISSSLAAEIYGLKILRKNIEDAAHNTTRFIVVSRKAEWAPADNGPVVTSLLFRVRSVPAALYKALGGFATNKVNISKLESYIVDGAFTVAQFFAEADGHPENEGMKFALDELKYFSTECRILGVYAAHPFRRAKR